MKSFKQFVLSEQLTPEQKADVSEWPRDPKALKHTDHFFGRGNDDVHEPLQGGVDKSEVHRAVERHLGHDIDHDNYRQGYTTDKHGRKIRLGSVLQKSKAPKELVHGFQNDNTRQGKNESKLTVHVTRSAAGVAGQTSGGQSWEQQSCKNYETGSRKHFLKHEVKHGTVVAYLKNHKGHELARTTFQPHHNDKGQPIFKKNSHYGLKSAAFDKHTDDLEKRLSASHQPTASMYKIHPKVYNDSGEEQHLHPNVTREHISKVLDDKDPDVRRKAIQHPNVTHEHISKALKDEDRIVRYNAIEHPKTTHEHISKALNDKDPDVRRKAIEHPNVTHEHISKALKDEHSDVRRKAIEHPNVTHEHISKALDDNYLYVRHKAIQHPNATSEHISKALNDKDHNVRRRAIQHPKATREHISKALDDSQPYVRQKAIQHPNATSEHISKALNDKDHNVRRLAREQQKLQGI